MTRLRTAFVAACTLALPPFGAGATGQATRTFEHDHPDIVVTGSGSRYYLGGLDAADRAGGVSITPDNQILVELAPDDTGPANLFDLSGRTVVFTPDGHGGYSRSVQSVAWEENIGDPVAPGAEIQLQSFRVDFGGERWGSFFVNRHGLLTFGEPLTYSYWDSENRFDTMSEIAAKFVTTPTISPLYKPMLGGRQDHYGATQHVKHEQDRVVITWTTMEPDYYEHGIPPDKPARLQVVLGADGTIRFSYADVFLGDGIVGLFPDDDVVKGDLITNVADGTDSELPGHLDLLDAAIYSSNTDAVILEFALRGSVPDPPASDWYSFRLHFDVDEPYWTHPVDWSDEDFTWQVDVRPDGERVARGQGVMRLLPTGSADRIALLVDIGGPGSGISGTAFAATAHFRNDSWVRGDDSRMALMELNAGPGSVVDLSRPDRAFSSRQREVFHYRSPPDPLMIACRVVAALGDEFDLFVFHNEFRVDSQESATPVRPHYGNARAMGTGIPWNFGVPCGEGRLKAVWELPVWMKSDHVVNDNRYQDERTRFDRGLLLFAHEFTHAWTAHASYLQDGERERLFGVYCQCHWREDLHLPAAFPWHAYELGPPSLMGGRYWRENRDGTFTPLDGYWGGGHSWLDLYMMGLAEASEVPDMFILRNLKPVGGDPWGPHTGRKEIVTIQQVVDAEGSREPSAADAQKDFNAAFVYLLEPGQTADADMLGLHAEYRDKVIEHWSHVTGGRSQITTTVPGGGGDEPDQPIDPGRTTPRTLDLTCHGYDEGVTRAYNCIPESSQQHHMGTFVPAVGSACDKGSIAEFPPGRIVFQIRCHDGSPAQSAAWSYSGQGRGSFVKPVDTPRVWLRTSFSGSSAHLSVWCRAPQENLLVNELLGTSWGNDGTNGIYGMTGCLEVEVDTGAENLQWWFTQELAATALTPPRSWEQVTGAGSALGAEALQDLATAAELERIWRQPGRWRMNPGQGASTRGAVLTSDDDRGTRLGLRIASEPDDGTDALDGAVLRGAVRTSPLTLDLTCHGYDEGATRAYNCIPEPSQQRYMRTFVPAVGSACDQGSIAEFPTGRIVFQIRCRDNSSGQSAAWSYSGQGPAFFEKPVDTPRVWVRTSFSGNSVHLSVWCRAPQENLVVNELLGTSWGNDGTSGIYGMAGCREVEVDTEGQDLQWWFTQDLAATALTPPRSWEEVSGGGSALPAEARQDLATATELERLWSRPGR